jgi:hypothetical protein
MLVALGMALTFSFAASACPATGFQHWAEYGLVHMGAPGRDRTGREADVGAIQVQADALAQIFQHVLAETGIGAGGARLGAVEARFDAGDESADIAGLLSRMSADHGLNMHGILPSGHAAGCSSTFSQPGWR